MTTNNVATQKQIELFNLYIDKLRTMHEEAIQQAERLILSIDHAELCLLEAGLYDDLDEASQDARAAALIFINSTSSIKRMLSWI